MRQYQRISLWDTGFTEGPCSHLRVQGPGTSGHRLLRAQAGRARSHGERPVRARPGPALGFVAAGTGGAHRDREVQAGTATSRPGRGLAPPRKTGGCPATVAGQRLPSDGGSGPAMEAEAAPVGTFPSFMTEGSLLLRRGEYGKALVCFNNALKLRGGDRDCLAERSKCFLRLGDTDNALKDAEASLQNDQTFSKGLYQKAEALYTMGDFEFALVFYHRGYRLRPELHKFKLGIEKSQEAIINCIGAPSSVKLENKGNLCFVSKQAECKQKVLIKAAKNPKWTKNQKPARNPKTERELLGELYADKAYLEKLLNDKDLMESSTQQGIKVKDLVLGGISYLETRSEFWQQQKPIYARVRERKLRQQRWTRDKKQKPLEVGRYMEKIMEDIDMLLSGDSPEESCKKAKRALRKVQAWSEDELPNRKELIADLYSRIGKAQLEMGQTEAALQSHRMDLEVARQHDLPDAVSRALENIGRVYASTRRFQPAIDTWEKKIPMVKSNLEKTWLFHEIGRCYLELDNAKAAQSYGQKSLQAADEEGDAEWQLHAMVLVAQAQVRLKDYRPAILTFEKALDKAALLHDEVAQKAIVTALDEVSKSFMEQLSERGEDSTAPSPRGASSSDTTKVDGFEKDAEAAPGAGAQRGARSGPGEEGATRGQ
ncbi:outer dynein arm-docking complex subunit 4 isoform X2 [Lathamus discolor]|uniref:outer dynein arm-docking complex subunit 4 isoform X2 n=1 Tax=Lathamus discolor TaxID=678569 RepID=UPI0032B7D550